MNSDIVALNGQAENVLSEIQETGNFDIGFKFIELFYEKVKQLDGVIGIVVDGMEKMWVPSEHEGETFMEAIRFDRRH